VIVKLGFLEIRWYSLAYIFGILLTYFILRKIAKQGRVKNLTLEKVDDLVVYLTLGLIIGARLFYFIFYNPAYFWTDPLEIFQIWHGGMSFHGGLIGMILGMVYFSKKFKVKFYDVADIVVIPVSLALFLGRIMNFINVDMLGTVSNLPWCVKYSGVEGCRHPISIYEALKNLGIFFILAFTYQKKKLKSGRLFWLFVLLYGVLRFVITFMRDDPVYFGFNIGQWLCLVMIGVSVVFLVKKN